MSTKCSKCQFENTFDSKFCKECGTQLIAQDKEPVPFTETLIVPREELDTGVIFADRYQIIQELGRGGMGRVYRVFDKKIKEEIALKLLKPEITSDENTIERFSNELKFARKIVHKNVCRMYDLNDEEGTHYISMEYVPGEDLKRIIRKTGTLSEGKSIAIAKQICKGLVEAHRLDVVHRDLKPSNIMIDKEGNARIMDFGIARSLRTEGITGDGFMVGTPEYMSPEQVDGRDADQRSDIYSLGIILYEIVTGRVPFEGDTSLSIALKHKTEKPENPRKLNSKISEKLSCLILTCLQKSEDKRYQTADEVHSELIKIENDLPLAERISTEERTLPLQRPSFQVSLKKLLLPAIIFVAVVLIGILIWIFLPQDEIAFIPSSQRSMAIISFENQTGDNSFEYLQNAIPNLLITSLEQSRDLSITTWERLEDLLKQIGRKEVEIIDKDLGFQLCQLDGIEIIVLGGLIKTGNMFATNIKIYEVETKQLLKSASIKGEGIDSILKSQIDDLSKEISRSAGIPENRIKKIQRPIVDITTNSMDAYNYFLRGRSDHDKLYFDDSRKFLEKAVESDPEFAVAYLYLAWTYGELGITKSRNEAYKMAKAYSAKASEKERLYIEAAYCAAIESNQEERIRLLNDIIKKYPKEKRAHYYLAIYYEREKNYSRAIEVYNLSLQLDPNYGDALNRLAYMYADLDNFDESIGYFKKYAAASPGDANPFDSMGEIYFRMGNLEEALAKYKEAIEVRPDFYFPYWTIGYINAYLENYPEAFKWLDKFIDYAPSPGAEADGQWWRGFLYYWLGRTKQSLHEFDKAEELAESVENDLLMAYISWIKGWINYDNKRFETSRQHFKNWYDIVLKMNAYYRPFYSSCLNFYLALLDIKQKHLDLAKSRLAKINSTVSDINPISRESVLFYRDLLNAEILLEEGDFEGAVAISKKTKPIKIPDVVLMNMARYNLPVITDVFARAYHATGELEKALDEYKRLVDIGRESQSRRLIYPKYYYCLAKLYERLADLDEAKKYYEKFLFLWKDADPGIAEVDDARKRLAGLR